MNVSENQKKVARKTIKIAQSKINDFTKLENLERMKKCSEKALKILKEKYPEGTFKNKSHSDETKKKMSDVKKGRVPWNKGKAWKDWHPTAKINNTPQ